MSELDLLNNLQTYAEKIIEQHAIPALSLAIWHQGELHQAAAGILNKNTGVEATTDSLFRIASITKVFTTSLVMQLVDEGKVNLDKPLKHYINDFQVANAEATHTITVRQLLNHSSGLAGDFSPNDNNHQGHLSARFVDRCNLLPVIHPVGDMYSYSNTAFALLGRLIEVVRGISWYQAMTDFIFTPLGMHHAVADPKDVIRYRAAIGHIPNPDNDKQWHFPERDYRVLGIAPCGTTTSISAGDLITFARAHLDGGLNNNGERWLSPESITAMQTPTIEKPKLIADRQTSVGLGWGITQYQSCGVKTIGHTGATGGCLSNLQLIPKTHSAFAILINGYRSSAMDALTRDLFFALTGRDNRAPEIPVITSAPDQRQKIVGCYESFDRKIDIDCQQGELTAMVTYKIDPKPPEAVYLQRTEEQGCFAALNKAGQRLANWGFLKPDKAGIPQYLFLGGRLNSRV